jgi:flagellar basal-body rod protein FlgF
MSELAEQVSSTLDGLTREFNLIAHNLANVNTIGYKRRFNSFSKTLMDHGVGSSPVSENETVSEIVFDFSQGRLNNTGRPLDVALDGKGFFVVETPEGPLYTRNGLFHLNQNGQIVDSLGRTVASDSGPITIPPNAGIEQIVIAGDGNITANGSPVGKFRVVEFGEDESKMMSVGNSCYSMSEDVKPLEADNMSFKQGFLEISNVQMVEELVNMIMVSRLYEANTQFISIKKDASKSLLGVAMG